MRERTDTGAGNEYRAGGPGQQGRLCRFADMSGYKVASDDPDVRGWKVKTRDGSTIGKVADLVVDTQSMKVRYIEVDLDDKKLNLKESRRVALPIGTARINDDDDYVILPEHDPGELAALPAVSGVLSHEEELAMRRSFDDRYSGDIGNEFYTHQNYDQNRFFGGRRRGRENEDYLTQIGRSSMSDESQRQSDLGRRH